MRVIILVLIASAFVMPARGTQPILLTIDSVLSSAGFELCVGDTCDSDSSGIAGGIFIDLDSVASPGLMNLFDYDFELTDQLDFFIDFGFGGIGVAATDLRLRYPNPGAPFGPVAIEGGAFEFLDVPSVASGVASYDATLLACIFLGAAGLPCQDQIDLGTLGEQTMDSIGGTVSIIGDEVIMVIDVALTLPILPDNPELAAIDFVGTIVAVGVVPECGAGDFNCDGVVDVFDFGAFVDCESGPGGGILVDGCETFDFDADVDVDLDDFGGFQRVFGGS